MRFGLDYTGHISAAAHKALGSTFACRYLSGGNAKDLDPGEAQALLAAGIDVVLVWETTAQRALGGEAVGQVDARAALAEATRLGHPAGRPIYFAVDFDETPAEANPVAAYFQGVRAVLGVERTGAYGGFWVIKRLFDAGLITYGWQTYAWSGGQVDPRAQLYQFSNAHTVAGVSVDYDHSLADDFGQWGFKPAPPDPAPHGKALFAGSFDVHSKQWTVRGTPNSNVEFDPAEKRWACALVRQRRGVWDVQPLPWDFRPPK